MEIGQTDFDVLRVADFLHKTKFENNDSLAIVAQKYCSGWFFEMVVFG